MAGSDPDPDERKLFRDAVKDVRPLRTSATVAPQGRAPRRRVAKAHFARAERAAVLAETLLPPPRDADLESGEELSFRRDGVQIAVLRRLRRGLYRIDDEVDLHGLTLAQAEAALRSFLSRAIQRRLGCVRIVHGKGLRSGNRGPVLKLMVNRLLPRFDAVVAFSSARLVDGGSGATLVLLARRA